jgi:hypothetical protein
MAINQWQAGTLYLPGSLVIPTTVSGSTPTVIPNADFESGDTDWTKGTGWAINSNGFFSGAIGAEYSGPGAADLVSSTKHAVEPGKSITASCFIAQGASDDGQANAAIILRWYTGADVFISDSTGNSISTGSVGVWKRSTVSGVAPPTAAKVSVGVSAYNDWAALYVDQFSWNYVTGAAAAALAYKTIGRSTGPQTDIAFVDSNPDTITRGAGSFIADGFAVGDVITVEGSAGNSSTFTIDVLAATTITLPAGESLVAEGAGPSITISTPAVAGTSGASEPDWPLTEGQTVVDNEITWQAVTVDSVTWEASSVLTSGGVEPTWPTEPGSFVSDNNIAWELTPLRIEDEFCPHTKVVAIAASKVFAGDTDIVRFCATLNARDWTSEDDAGFLPTGLQQKSQVGVDAMGVYRGNLAVWSASTFQVWQVDPDPASMALLDAMEGIGSIHQQAVQPVSDDLFFLSALGVRTVAIAEGTNNLATGDVGVPIDILVQAEANAVDVEPVASYYPGAGQYWLAFRPLTIGAALLAGQFLLTSPVYPIEAEDAIINDTRPSYARLLGIGVEEAIINDTAPSHAILQDILVEYSEYEEAIINETEPSFGLIDGGLVTHDYEDAIISDTSPSFAFIDGDLIVYPNYEDAIINDTDPQDSTLV